MKFLALFSVFAVVLVMTAAVPIDEEKSTTATVPDDENTFQGSMDLKITFEGDRDDIENSDEIVPEGLTVFR